MKFLHSMVRVKNLDLSIQFFTEVIGLRENRRYDSEKGRYTNVFLGTKSQENIIELTYNWDQEDDYTQGRNFGHLAFQVENIYDYCQKLIDHGITINRPPRDGYMAFIKTPDNISIEILQKGQPLELREPWKSMSNTGTW